MSEDHPRTRGEKAALRVDLQVVLGSPPHTRGKVRKNSIRGCISRITPAHAGKSSKEMRSAVTEKDHPRTRGEKGVFPCSTYRANGSPPHTRGKGFSLVVLSSSSRITPAHAGKSPFLYIIFHFVEDHPRTRGEKLTNLLSSIMNIGSPPHTRGKVPSHGRDDPQRRITPAHAGKRGSRACRKCWRWDHPRTRGEKTATATQRKGIVGSPPHTRGKVWFSLLIL